MSLLAAGVLLVGVSKLFGAAADRKAARSEIKISKLNAGLIREETAEETRRLEREIAQTEGLASAISASSGVQMSGSRELVAKDIKQENRAQLDWLKKSGLQREKVVLAGGQLQASQLRSQAKGKTMTALFGPGGGLFS